MIRFKKCPKLNKKRMKRAFNNLGLSRIRHWAKTSVWTTESCTCKMFSPSLSIKFAMKLNIVLTLSRQLRPKSKNWIFLNNYFTGMRVSIRTKRMVQEMEMGRKFLLAPMRPPKLISNQKIWSLRPYQDNNCHKIHLNITNILNKSVIKSLRNIQIWLRMHTSTYAICISWATISLSASTTARNFSPLIVLQFKLSIMFTCILLSQSACLEDMRSPLSTWRLQRGWLLKITMVKAVKREASRIRRMVNLLVDWLSKLSSSLGP